ncbi:hypothetical protein K8Z61_06935 [Nocardioides sp. TRM66260-LWL]|uniref:hypothetical protein n=1 Tax=Nocardioides sp. TRM66260-LWL TaxID=2874478 RepID=UPI001CC56D43|nr:hypothetical protein [Nocardioides sp. TRM66260-LWL]MBZ5734227.1 hypothetical protein [Nocardioides sp. TRM66260-LWL]
MKKAILALVVLFVGFWLVQDPQGLADVARSGAAQTVDLGGRLFDGLLTFIRELG